jgi:flagellar basal body-associated protein FliL
MKMNDSIVRLLLFVALIANCIACGSGSGKLDPSDPEQVLDQFKQEARKHHPKNFAEVDLGEFAVVHRRDKHVLFIRCQLFAVMPKGDQSEFSKSLNSHKLRMKEAVVQTFRASDRVKINDPNLKQLRDDLVVAINKAMNTRVLRNIVFTSFSVARG